MGWVLCVEFKDDMFDLLERVCIDLKSLHWARKVWVMRMKVLAMHLLARWISEIANLGLKLLKSFLVDFARKLHVFKFF